MVYIIYLLHKLEARVTINKINLTQLSTAKIYALQCS